MNKICTSIEQSEKLIELGIDVITADMDYVQFANNPKKYDCVVNMWNNEHEFDWTPAWSLASLLNVIKDKCGYFELVYLKQTSDSNANPLEDVYRLSTDVYDVYNKEAVDACVEMIIKLHEQKLL